MTKPVLFALLILTSFASNSSEITITSSYIKSCIHGVLNTLASTQLAPDNFPDLVNYIDRLTIREATGDIYINVGSSHIKQIKTYITQGATGAIQYVSNKPESFLGKHQWPELSDLKVIIDNFDNREAIFFTGGIARNSFLTALSIHYYVSEHNESGADYLQSNEMCFIIYSVASMLLYHLTNNKLLYMISDGHALASFLSVAVRYYANGDQEISSKKAIPCTLLFTIPLVAGSSYAGIKYSSNVLRTAILLTPVIIEHTLGWIVPWIRQPESEFDQARVE